MRTKLAIRLFILCIFLFVISTSTNAQLSGIKTIGVDYPTLQSAIAALNTQGVTEPGVIFNIPAGYTETFTNVKAGVITTNTSSKLAPIVIQKIGAGNNPTIMPCYGVGTDDAIIAIVGTDYITFDGLFLKDNPLNFDNSSYEMEYGIAIYKQSTANGSQYITIKNCTITFGSTGLCNRRTGIAALPFVYQVNTAIEVTDTAGSNSHLRIFKNSISYATNGISLWGGGDTNPAYNYADHDNQVGIEGANYISNLVCVDTKGISALYQNGVKIGNNFISGSAVNEYGLGIYVLGDENLNAEIYSNTISGFTIGWKYSSAKGIEVYLKNDGIANSIKIYNNNIFNFNGNGEADDLRGINIYNSPKQLEIYGNNIYGFSVKRDGYINGIALESGSGNIYNNSIHNFTGNLAKTINGIYITSTIEKNTNLFLNDISDFVFGNGIYVNNSTVPSVISFYKNKLRNLTTGLNIMKADTAFISNNYVSNTLSGVSDVNGIYSERVNYLGIYSNTMYLNITSPHVPNNTNVIEIQFINTLDLRNNILVNTSDNFSDQGKSIVLNFMYFNFLKNYSTKSNGNCFYAGVPGPKRLIASILGRDYQTINQFNEFVAPRDSSSFSEQPPFIAPANNPVDLHLATNMPTLCESGGIRVNDLYKVVNDFDGESRCKEVGYTGLGTAPDIGADEGNFKTFPPLITAHPNNGKVCEGGNYIFKVSKKSNFPVLFQWQLSSDSGKVYQDISDNAIYTGAQTPSLNLKGAFLSLEKNWYRCKLTNIGGDSYSNPGTIKIVTLLPSAGNDQLICSDSTVLEGISPLSTVGVWRVISGNAILIDSTLSNTNVSKLAKGSNLLRWIITNGDCSASDDVLITNNSFTVSAGNDQSICSDSTSLDGTILGTYSGTWQVISGGATFKDSTLPTTQVSNLVKGSNLLRLIVTNGNCIASDDVLITNNSFTVSAGNDQSICMDQATLDGENLEQATGSWAMVSGFGLIKDSNYYNSEVTNLSVGKNTFIWKVLKDGCQTVDTMNIIHLAPLEIINQPESQLIAIGQSVLFKIIAKGPITRFQWRKNKFPLIESDNVHGANFSNLLIDKVSHTELGQYDCILSGECDSVISETADLDIKTEIMNLVNEDIILYPNPTNGKCYVLTDKNYKLCITDLFGRVIVEQTINENKFEINLIKQPVGIYIIKFELNGEVFYKKILHN